MITACKTKDECNDPHAICLNGDCVCEDGYILKGGNCKEITCDDHPCGSIGICEEITGDEKFECKCPPDSFGNGYHCYDSPCYKAPCQNGGVCEKKDKNGYKCICPIGFSGVSCERHEIELSCDGRTVDIPFCENSGAPTETCNDTPCKNNGICLPVRTGQFKYKCKCKSGYTGRTCDTKINEQCNEHGVCKLKLKEEGQCLEVGCNCFIRYSGQQCLEKATDCNDDSDCRNGGRCEEKQCDCAPGFKGAFCDEREHQSYIHFPRIHFAGRFQADQSTINNYPDNFDTESFPKTSVGWNPTGSSAWRLRETRITRVCYANEACTSFVSDDALINTLLEDSNLAGSAKLVDLDVHFQDSSAIYGWSMQVRDFFKADFQRVGFRYMWRKMKAGHGLAVYGAAYQSVLKNVQFGNRSEDSRITKYLKEHLERSDKKELSIRFNVDMYDSSSTTANFSYGRIVGSIGISGRDSPPYVTFGRMLKPIIGTGPDFWYTPFVYDQEKKTILIDLGNSLGITEEGIPLKSIGNMAIAYTDNNEDDNIKCPKVWNPFGRISFNDLKKYTLTSGVFQIDVGEQDISKRRVILAQVDENGMCTQVVLAEDRQGVEIHPLTRWVHRAVPEEDVNVRLFLTIYGKPPSEDDSFNVSVSPSGSITKKGHGIFEFKTTTKDPDNARLFINGDVSFFKYYLSGREPPADDDVNSAIVILVWDKFEVPTQPNWIRHVKPIFKQYATLYPVMKINFLDLSNYFEVVKNKYPLTKIMSLDVEDPRYMPVTRDLSPGKVQMILKWLQDDTPRYGYSNLGIDMFTLKHLLQTALQLEHSTIPPYLTGYLSIKKGYNTEVKSMLKDILIDEMHHLAQVSNILNAIDGNPNLFAEHFVPSYPSYLPGGVHPEVKITVNKMSMLQIRNVYMVLETPSKELEENGLINAIDEITKNTLYNPTNAKSTYSEDPACADVLTLYNDVVMKSENILTNHNTIGDLYTTILIVMAKLQCAGLLKFDGKKNQLEVGGKSGKKVMKVYDFGTAVQAIKNIVKEGEGSSPCNPLDQNTDLSHYYKFASMANKRHIKTIQKDSKVETTDPDHECLGSKASTFAYIGKKLPFDEDGIWPIVNNPMMSMYKEGSRVEILAKLFSKSYWRLLKLLQNVFDGKTYLFGDSVAKMKDLLIHGNSLVQMPIEENGNPEVGPNAGPIYPTNEP
ncbi:uncharacterized protein LOC114538017 [Dendronephthya gigantea]|uniref:uncharacterized protein LOC114538017 n=1 Tax=Dendronephthya gigantea TaxID=151771 RepID=UPI00106C6C69|nr:uncharacterized protein LOC114538017 [Dendronephthya gigantea]